jgi:hypothetical protein
MTNKRRSFREGLGKALSIAAGTAVFAILIYVFGILPLQTAALKAKERNLTLEENLQLVNLKVKKKGEITSALTNSVERLGEWEKEFPEGDVYLWMLKKFQDFEATMPIRIINVSPPRVQDTEGFPKVPYPSTSYSVVGNAYFEDFGNFLAEFENSFPLFTFKKLELEPLAISSSDDQPNETLQFKMEFSSISKAVSN